MLSTGSCRPKKAAACRGGEQAAETQPPGTGSRCNNVTRSSLFRHGQLFSEPQERGHVVCHTMYKGSDMDQVSASQPRSNNFYRKSEEGISANHLPALTPQTHDLGRDTYGITSLINRHPIEATAIALLAGVGLALLISQGRRPSRRSSEQSWFDPSTAAENAMSSVRSTASPVLPAVERMVEAVADMSSRSAPIDRVVEMWRSLTGR